MQSMKQNKITTTHTLPAYWASYLINMDRSSLTDQEVSEIDFYTKDLGMCIDVSDDSYFSQFKGIGHTVCEYTFVTY